MREGEQERKKGVRSAIVLTSKHRQSGNSHDAPRLVIAVLTDRLFVSVPGFSTCQPAEFGL